MKKTVIFNALQTSLSGGIGRYCYEISKSMYDNKGDINLKIVIRKEDKDKYLFAEDKDLIIIEGITNGIKRNIFEQFKLPKLIEENYPDALIHYPDTMAPIFSKNKIVTTMHDMAFRTLEDEFSFKTKLWKKIITGKSVKKVDKIVAITNFTKSEIEKYYPEQSNKINVIYNGFNDFSNEPIVIKNINEGIKNISGKFILSVNTITPRKNISGIINSFNLIKEKTDAKLVIAGGNGYKSEEIFDLSKKLDLEDRIVFTGKINDDELKYLYKKAALYIYISFYEGFGLSPLEAMSYGVPTIVSNVTSIPEVVGNRAIKVAPNDTEEIAKNMYKLLENNKFRESILEKMYTEKVGFSWGKSGKEMIELYKNI